MCHCNEKKNEICSKPVLPIPSYTYICMSSIITIFVVIINKFIGATAIIKTIPSTSTHVRNLYDMLIIYIRERDNNKLINVVVLLCACIYNLQICGSGTLFIQPLFIATFI